MQNVCIEIDLLWLSSENVNNDNLCYDIYVGTTAELVEADLLAKDLNVLEYKLKNLKGERTYYWRVDMRNSNNKTVSFVEVSPSTVIELND